MSSSYLTDLAYLRQFCPELSPARLRAGAALAGFPAPAHDDFDYCELGAGYGDTTVALAAAYPSARFVAIDLNPEHVAFARGRVERAGLTNARLLAGDFTRPDDEPLPDFDFVCAHGVLSWVPPETARGLIAFAAARLRPGGLLYVSYNALPGWAAVEPLRRLLLDAAGEGPTLERARRALAAATMLRSAGAQYFARNPAAGEMVTTMTELGPVYVAHEYLQPHWHPRYFADVAREMTAAGLQYAGQLPLYRNLPALAVPEGLRGALDHALAADPLAAEPLKDYATNTFFRGDLYRKGPPCPADAAATRDYLDSTPMSPWAGADRAAPELRLPHGTVDLSGPAFGAVMAALDARPASARELAREPALAALGLDAVRDAVATLLACERLTPVRAPREDDVVARHFNRAALAEPLAEGQPVVLASPRAGTGLSLPALHAVYLRLLTGVAAADRRAWLRAFVARQPVRLQARGRAVVDPAEQVQVLEAELERFKVTRLPRLIALGVVDACA